ncbi:hypothetical protein [Mesorhizobium sp. NZP2077]|uniref:hypothetical protein n=1 Tax=Mesorhizobium sp. NZP2077 TaxID=2483404 RepID=UPI001551944C|nr:hypothetical protein [Mesorhizobium sp. NZP2077]QKC83253.1 hypothetical protein EB232_17995 [Mesorhizobium sp. NZP2077]QKD16769.1 hypothetical protein HGP13_17775 [Mesorhizobium sp. NZP2077]
MADTMLPILRQLHEADGDRSRADTLLRMPDSVMLKYQMVIEGACRRAGFEAGRNYLALRVSLSLAVRDADGLPPTELSITWEQYRRALVEFAAGGK